jgi:hypothetical protein
VFAHACKMGLEGIVCRRRPSRACRDVADPCNRPLIAKASQGHSDSQKTVAQKRESAFAYSLGNGVMVLQSEKCRAKARECEGLANTDHDHRLRKFWLGLALHWHQLAKALEKNERTGLRPAQLELELRPKNEVVA